MMCGENMADNITKVFRQSRESVLVCDITEVILAGSCVRLVGTLWFPLSVLKV